MQRYIRSHCNGMEPFLGYFLGILGFCVNTGSLAKDLATLAKIEGKRTKRKVRRGEKTARSARVCSLVLPIPAYRRERSILARNLVELAKLPSLWGCCVP